MPNTRIKGIIPIALTPMLKNGDIDTQSCATLIEYLIKNEVAAIFILGSASENFMLDTNQRLKAVEAMAEANKGRIPIIAGCSNMAPREVYRFFEGVNGLPLHALHYIPYDLKLGDKPLITLINDYADRSPFPLYLYHNIKRGRAITFKIAKELKQHFKVIGMKVGGYNLSEMKQMLTLDDENFQIFGSGGGQVLPWLSFGAAAVTASSACCFPKEFNNLYDSYISGDLKKAEQIQSWWQHFHASIPNTAPDNGEYAAEEKYILKKKGVIAHQYCHFPYRELTPGEMEQIDLTLNPKSLPA